MNQKPIGLFLLLAALALSGCTQSGANTGLASAPAAQDLLIEIKGSDTTVQVVSNLAEAFSEQNPAARVSVTGGGSGTGIAALINGEVLIANSSRPIKESELELGQARGLNITQAIIGRDTLSVLVHESNPVSELTVEQVGQIFRGEIANWKEVGGNDEAISLYGRQSTSGTYIYFQEEVVKGDYSSKMRNMEGSQAIVDSAKQDTGAIGYVGVGYTVDSSGAHVSKTKTVRIAKNSNDEFIYPLDPGVLSRYALSRPLFQYFAQKPSADSAIGKFLAFELSDAGQQIVLESGFFELLDEDRIQNEKNLS